MLAELGPVGFQVLGQLIHRHPVDAGTTLFFLTRFSAA